jgi:hypothetical protein
MNIKKVIAMITALTLVLTIGSSLVLAGFGDPLMSFSPTPSGSGRGVAHDPSTGLLYYTNVGDPNIYVFDISLGITIGAIPTGFNYAALSWDAKRGVLWGGHYDANPSGGVDQITLTGVVTPMFVFPFPAGDSFYAQPPGYIDGLAYDEGDPTTNLDDSLWMSDDNAFTLYHVDLAGNLIASYPIPPGRGNTGIAVNGQYLWLALQSGPDTPPHDIVRVAKTNPTVILSSFLFSNTNPGPEDIEFDVTTFAPMHAVIWTNQWGWTTLTAWELEDGIKPEVPIIVEIDIKPGSYPNSINTKSKGVIPVAILGSASLNVFTVDVTTLRFGPGGAQPAHDLTNPMVFWDHIQDVNGDGFIDLVSHYRQKQTGLSPGDVVACLTGQFTNGFYFAGCDSVRIVH